MLKKLLVWSALLATVSLLVGSALRRGMHENLALSERLVLDLPQGLSPTGLSIRNLSNFVAWSALDGSVHLVLDNAKLRLAPGAIARPVAAFLDSSLDFAEVVDAARSQIVVLSKHAHIVRRERFVAPGIIESGVRTERGWVVGARGQQLSYVLALLRDSLPPKVLATIPAVDPSRLFTAHLSNWGRREVVVTQINAPYSVSVYSLDGSRRTLRAVHMDSAFRGGKWIALPAVKLDRGWVQVFGDLTSDERVIVLNDHRNRIIRTLRMRAPFAFHSANARSRTLWAARNTNGTQLLEYRWRWN